MTFLPNGSTQAQASVSKQEKYHKIIGFIMFSIVQMQLDIAFATLIISRFAKNLSYQYAKVVKIILNYLKNL